MQNKTLSIVIGIIIILAVGGLAFYQYSNQPASTGGGDITTTGGDTSQTFTLAQIASHKDAASCYTAINGKVYDLTKWVPLHPGGQEAILSICGKDGSAAFNEQHGTAQRQQDILKTYYIGTLGQ